MNMSVMFATAFHLSGLGVNLEERNGNAWFILDNRFRCKFEQRGDLQFTWDTKT